MYDLYPWPQPINLLSVLKLLELVAVVVVVVVADSDVSTCPVVVLIVVVVVVLELRLVDITKPGKIVPTSSAVVTLMLFLLLHEDVKGYTSSLWVKQTRTELAHCF